ncbi:hypothetical protein Scep_013704 [Stephania cephalantha]|uniref:GRF-type domain-containing protein n=1 Tax=Stephania cephalantha TaxID=152367 RepID=A0AAP0IZY8_9MAGN
MQMNLEASPGSLQSKAFPCEGKNDARVAEIFPVVEDENGAHSGDDVVKPDSSLYNESLAHPSEGPYGPMHHQDFYMWPNIYPEFQMANHYLWNAFDSCYLMNRECYFPEESRIQYVPFKMFSQGYPTNFQFQEFQYFVVIDFEATCDKERNPHPQEIIEFPSVIVNGVTGQLEASFQMYVRPIYHQRLTDFCKELTGIQQIQVDRGVPLSEALLMHDKWLEDKGIKHTNFAVVTWSNWDCRVMLESECRYKRIRKPPYFNSWINLKVPFHEVFGGIRCNLKEAVQLAGLAWEGRAHCGLHDARNTARLLANLLHRGIHFSITNSIMWHDVDHPMARHPSADHPLDPNLYPTVQKRSLGPLVQFHPTYMDPSKEPRIFCFCGVKSSKCMVRKPGPKHGSFFFGCGNWTAARGAACPYFEWASP